MQLGTKPKGPGGRPRKFDPGEALAKMQRRLWASGLSNASLDDIARSAGINRPSLAAAFGDKEAIYAQAAAQYVALIDGRMQQALAHPDLKAALLAGFDAAIALYTAEGPDGCFVLCTAPAEAQTSPTCRAILEAALESIDTVFLRRLALEPSPVSADPVDLPLLAAQLGAMLHSVALRARAGWAAERLRRLAAGAVHQAVAAVRDAPGA